MPNKNDFTIGDQINFVYNGGSRPGAQRIVDVKEVYDGTIRGFDHYSKEDRTFSYNKMKSVGYIYKMRKENSINYIRVLPTEIVLSVIFADGSKMGLATHNNNLAINGVIIESVKDFQRIT